MPELFPGSVSPGGVGVSPAHQKPRRGWAALPLRERVVNAGKNAAGRSKLTFRYRPLAAWPAELLDQAEILVELYFQHFGGFRLADQAVMRAWVEALGMFTADEIRWALRAKWRSLQGVSPEEIIEKQKFRAAPANFPRYIGYWLEQSPEHQARQAEARRKEAARRIDDLAAIGRAGGGAGVSPASPPASQPKVDHRARREAFWQQLSDAQRAAARRAVEPQFKERARTWGMNPEDPQLDGVLRDMAVNWATFTWPADDRES